MNSELQCFMSEKDEEEFLSFSREFVEYIDKSSDVQFFLHIGGNRIQLLRTEVFDEVMVKGRIALRTSGVEKDKSAEKTFRKFQRWLKKSYSNDLTAKNVNIRGSERKINSIWLGPDAKKQVEEKGLVLSQNRKAIVIFKYVRES